MSEYAIMVKQAGQAVADKAVSLGYIDGPAEPAVTQPKLKLVRGDKDSAPADFTFIDLFAGIGYTDDAAVIAALIATLGANIKRRHRDQAEDAVQRLKGK